MFYDRIKVLLREITALWYHTRMSAATAPSLRRVRPATRLPWVFVFLLAVATLLVVVLLGFIFFEIVYSFHVLPNVSVWSVDLSGLSRDEAAAVLDSRLATKFNGTTIEITDGTKTWYATPVDLGLRLDARATAQAALDVARGDVNQQLAVAFNGMNLPPSISFDPSTARGFLTQLAKQINREPIDAGLHFNGTTVITTPAQIGRVLNVDGAMALLSNLARTLDQPRLTLPIETRTPRIVDTSAVAARLQKILNSNFTLDLQNPAPGEPASWT